MGNDEGAVVEVLDTNMYVASLTMLPQLPGMVQYSWQFFCHRG